jgi:hypothetical protein
MARANSPLKGRVIFAVGARRSGTNWLQRILAAPPDVAAMPTETYLFSHGIARLAERFQHATPNLPKTGVTFVPRDAFLDSIREFADRMFEENLRVISPNARYLIERTPWHVYHLDLIADVYPDAPIVHIIRDGRDVARSLLSKGWGPQTMEAAAEEWRSSVAAGRSAGSALPRYVEVFYERVLTDPEAEIRSLYRRLGLEVGPETLEQAVLEARSAFNVDPVFPKIGSGKWRTALTTADLRTFERIAGPLLEELGYEREPPPRGGVRERIAAATSRAWRRAVAAVRPRQAIRAALQRGYDRGSSERFEGNAALLQRLQDALAQREHGPLQELLAPEAHVRIVDEGGAWDGRGPEGATQLLAVLDRHERRGTRQLTSAVHPSMDAFTVVSTYALDDGRVWARTLVVTIGGDRVRDLTLYCYALPAARAGQQDYRVNERAASQ